MLQTWFTFGTHAFHLALRSLNKTASIFPCSGRRSVFSGGAKLIISNLVF